MPYTAISLGWGVQSTTLAVMSALGDLPPVDVAIHADTRHESKLTYEYAARWTTWLVDRGVMVETVYNDTYANITDNSGSVIIPAYVNTLDGGKLSRQCTQKWKRAPMRRYLQEHRGGQPVEQWIGISLDEFQRMKPSDVKYITHRWPLIDAKMTRHDCELYLLAHGIEVPPKSACTFCPFHNTAEWRRIKKTPEDWQEAVSVDRAIRKARPPYDLFVHPSRKPLEDVDLRTEQERGQLSLWDENQWNDECSGICGV